MADCGVIPATLCRRITDDTPVVLKTTCRRGLRQVEGLPSCIHRDAKDQDNGLRSREEHSTLLVGPSTHGDQILVLVSRRLEARGCRGTKYAWCRCGIVRSTWIMFF
jgi:hypothetical protein